jgi:mono/diheme cytochrome c family protein
MNPDAWYSKKPFLGMPGPPGAHNWYPMSFSPVTGLVYLPVQETPWTFSPPPPPPKRGVALAPLVFPAAPNWKGYLVAWDPVQQKEVWRADQPEAANGGTLASAGNLVFEGDVNGIFHAYAADSGKELWSQDIQSDPMAGPVTYTVDGEQYVAVLTGLGGGSGLMSGGELSRSGPKRNISRVVAFKLGGSVALPPAPPVPRAPAPPALAADAATIAKGALLYGHNCVACHGMNAVAGILPDLRYTPFLASDGWYQVVLNGALRNAGMLAFADRMSRQDADAVRAYLIDRARQSTQGKPTPVPNSGMGTPQ